jgi:glucokinase
VNTLGIDIGGTKIAGGVVSPEGELLQRVEKPTHAQDPDAIISTIREIVDSLHGPEHSPTVGVAVAAFLDAKREKLYFSPNITWKNFPLKAKLQEVLDRPVILENDANAAGWAEYRFGAAKASESMMMLTMGTGVGGAIVEAGRLMVGGFGAAGELGHIVIEPGGLLCGCGNKGCLEQYASGTALMREARARVGDQNLTSEQLAVLLENKDAQALDAFRVVCDAMGRGIASLVAVTDPDTVVIGGGVAKAGELLGRQITESFHAHYGSRHKRPTANIAVATLGNTAGIIGAADLAHHATVSGT